MFTAHTFNLTLVQAAFFQQLLKNQFEIRASQVWYMYSKNILPDNRQQWQST